MSRELSGVFDYKIVSTVKDRAYTSAFRNAVYKALVGTEGVSNQIGNKLNLLDISDGVDLKVRLLDGVAFVAGSSYRLYDDGTGNSKDLDIDPEVVSVNRIDSIVLEFSSLDVDRVVVAKVVKGVGGVSPVPPTLIQQDVEDAKGVYQLELFRVTITGANQTAVGITDVRPFYNSLRQQFLNFVGIVDGSIIVGEADLAALAVLAEADENGRNIADNLQINTYNSLESIGLTDTGDMSAVDLEGNMLKIFNAMDSPAELNIELFGDTNPNFYFSIITELPAFVGGSAAFKSYGVSPGANSRPNTVELIENNYSALRRSRYIGNYDNVWQGFTKVIDEKQNSNYAFHSFGELDLTDVDFSAVDFGLNVGLIVGKLASFPINGGSSEIINQFSNTGIENYPNLIASIQLEIGSINPNFRMSITTSFDEKNGGAVEGGVNKVELWLNNENNVLIGTYDSVWLGFKTVFPIPVENFGSGGLSITTDDDVLNATVITSSFPSIYTHFILEVGTSSLIDTIFIEVSTTLTSATPHNEVIDDSASNLQGFDEAYCKFVVVAGDLKGYNARGRQWSGNEEDDALNGTTLIRVFKVWGGIR